MPSKQYRPGSALLASDLNELQDTYIDVAFSSWTPLGSGSFFVYPNSTKYPLYAAPNDPSWHWNTDTARGGLRAGHLDRADFPTSYNGMLRDLKLKMTVEVVANNETLGSLLNSISLRNVPNLALGPIPEAPSYSKYLLGPEYGKITFPPMPEHVAERTYGSEEFDFPPKGLYTIELVVGGGIGGFQGAEVQVYLEWRAV